MSGIIDAHQHFWRYHPVKHEWINDSMAVIRKDFLPADLEPVLVVNGVAGCVAVQADQTAAETDFLLQCAKESDFIKGIVGWVDLRAGSIQERLEHLAQFNTIKGFRHILQGEAPEFMLQPAFLHGIGLLHNYNFTYDILVFPRHLPAVLQLVKQFPDQPFVIDHIAKPSIKDGLIDQWKRDMAAVADYPNVFCKVSGLVTESDMRNWKQADFTPYLDAVTEYFGVQRILYGSDWPVCLCAGAYQEVLGIVQNHFAAFSADEQQLIFEKNATAFYHLT